MGRKYGIQWTNSIENMLQRNIKTNYKLYIKYDNTENEQWQVDKLHIKWKRVVGGNEWINSWYREMTLRLNRDLNGRRWVENEETGSCRQLSGT